MSVVPRFLKVMSEVVNVDQTPVVEPVIIALDQVRGIYSNADGGCAIVIGDDSYLKAQHTFEAVAEALAVADSFGYVIDLVAFAMDRDVRAENVAPDLRRDEAVKNAHAAANKKIN